MCDRSVSDDPFLIVYCLDEYTTQRMCGKTVDDSLAALKLSPDQVVTNKIITNPFTALYTDENILYFNEDSGNAVFNCNEMGIFNIDLNNISLDNNFDKDDPDIIIIVIRLLPWHVIFEKRKVLKEINEKLMPVACHRNR